MRTTILSLSSTLFIVSAATSAIITVDQLSFTFSPDSVNAQVGDTIKWVWHGGGHTVTSGPNCTASGSFNATLSTSMPTFTWVVPASAAGQTIQYFCAPHCLGGMDGAIVVAPTAIPGDLNSDGIVSGLDLAVMLSAWGTANQPADINNDGVVSGPDLAIVLANWTV